MVRKDGSPVEFSRRIEYLSMNSEGNDESNVLPSERLEEGERLGLSQREAVTLPVGQHPISNNTSNSQVSALVGLGDVLDDLSGSRHPSQYLIATVEFGE